ncbi:MAG TPA: GNAT family N-acetyltransferase, partial [Anaerolineales bacterium]
MPEIEIRHAISTDIPALMNIEHYYQTSYVWQMDRTLEEGQYAARFREVRLPRQVRVEYPHTPSWLLTGWKDEPVLLIALFSGEPVGYICATEQLSAGTAWVRDLVVCEKMRRKGIATALTLAAQ